MDDLDDLIARNTRKWAHLLASDGHVITRTWYNTRTGEATTELLDPLDVFIDPTLAKPQPPAQPGRGNHDTGE